MFPPSLTHLHPNKLFLLKLMAGKYTVLDSSGNFAHVQGKVTLK